MNVITATQAFCPFVSTIFGERRSLFVINVFSIGQGPRDAELCKFCSNAG